MVSPRNELVANPARLPLRRQAMAAMVNESFRPLTDREKFAGCWVNTAQIAVPGARARIPSH
jgi:hypothetical protein